MMPILSLKCTSCRFTLRSEMLVVGLHQSPLGGIIWQSEGAMAKKTKGKLSVKVAASIAVSGNYEDDKDDGETLVYTGVW